MSISQEITLKNIELARFFFALTLLLISAHFIGHLFNKFKLPRVGGEIVGGILLGPSLLGYFFPAVYERIFHGFATEGALLALFYNFGMVLLMFISGLEVQKTVSKDERKDIAAIFLGSTIIPFAAGLLAPQVYDFTPYLGTKNSMPALMLVIAIAAAVTSIPVLSKIFIDLKIINTKFAKIILITATLHDIVLWTALAIATGLAIDKTISFIQVAIPVIITMAFFLVTILIMPKVLRFAEKSEYNFMMKSSATGYSLFICFLFVTIASFLDVNIVFGALLAGVVFGVTTTNNYQDEIAHVKEISTGFFIPIYFAIVGIKIDLIHHFEPLFFIGFLLFTTTVEIIGSMLAARYLKKDWFSTLNICVAMTTRGGPGIVLATVAFDLGIINEVLFVTMVLVAIVTSTFSGYWFRYVLANGWELLKA